MAMQNVEMEKSAARAGRHGEFPGAEADSRPSPQHVLGFSKQRPGGV